jgi:AraC family transcriptional regulator
LFKRELGMGPTEFSLKLRLAHAHQQINHGQATLLEVARQCGFTNPSHFTRSFRADYGQSPGALRKHAAKSAASGRP